MKLILVLLVFLFLGASMAAGDLCPQCKGKVYMANVGKCSRCGGTTTSGAFQLCKACSAKFGLCEACGVQLPPPRNEDKPLARPAASWWQAYEKPLALTDEQKQKFAAWARQQADVPSNEKVRQALLPLLDNRQTIALLWLQNQGRPIPQKLGYSGLVEADDSADGKKIAAAAGQLVVIKLAGNATTGYLWGQPDLQGASLKAVGKTEYLASPAPRGMVGTGGHAYVLLEAAAAGKTTVTLAYKRPWETQANRTFRLQVEVTAPSASSPDKPPPASQDNLQKARQKALKFRTPL